MKVSKNVGTFKGGIFKIYFVLFERQGNWEEGKERENPSTGSLPDGHKSQAEARSFVQASQVGDRTPGNWAICCLPTCFNKELHQKWELSKTT